MILLQISEALDILHIHRTHRDFPKRELDVSQGVISDLNEDLVVNRALRLGQQQKLDKRMKHHECFNTTQHSQLVVRFCLSLLV